MSGATTLATQSQPAGLSGLITALDNTKIMRVGENGHTEYAWNSNDLQEQLVQFSFQTVRTPDFATRYELTTRFQKWVAAVLTPAFYSGQTTLERRKEAISLALYGYKMVAQLRDTEAGKGECRLAYDMLYGWYTGVKQAAYNVAASGAASLADSLHDLAFESTTTLATRFMFNEGEDVQYGSFKDFKYICHEFSLLHLASQSRSAPSDVHHKFVARTSVATKDHTGKKTHRYRTGSETFRFTPELMMFLRSHPVIAYLASTYGARIMSDYANIAHNTSGGTSPRISLAGKWAPRASSKLFAPLRTLLFATAVPESELWKETALAKQSKDSLKKAELKIDTVYRQRLSAINKALETVQVKQCEKKWATIDFDKHVTSVTLARQKKAFAKKGSNADAARSGDHEEQDIDRVQCAENFAAFMERVKTGTSTAKGKKVAVTDFVKEALRISQATAFGNRANDEEQNELINEKALLDGQWDDKGTTISQLDDFVAMVDVSGSMECDGNYPMNTAIGLGIRIAEKSRLGNRVMTFSDRPSWVNLADTPSFTDRVAVVKQAPWGGSTDFYRAFKLILDAVATAKLTPAEVAKLTFVILSDMQMNEADSHASGSIGGGRAALFTRIADEFANAGKRICGEPYPVPKMVFWNLRTTQGFPTSTSDENAIMVSGGSDVILNDLCERGLEALTTINPWTAFVESLSKARYSSLDHVLADWMV